MHDPLGRPGAPGCFKTDARPDAHSLEVSNDDPRPVSELAMDEKQILGAGIGKAEVALDDTDKVEEHETVEAERVFSDLNLALLSGSAVRQHCLDPLPRRQALFPQESRLLGGDQVDAEPLRRLFMNGRAAA
jgi:hypothetical protein